MTNSPITLDAPSSSGGFAIRETLRFAFFVRKRHLDLAPAAVQAIEMLIDAFPPPALSMFAIESGDWLTFDSAGLKRRVRRRLIGKDKPINGMLSLSGDQANIPDYAVEYIGRAIDFPSMSLATNTLWFFIAGSALTSQKTTALQVSKRIHTLLGCQASYVDIALEGDRRRLQEMARRYQFIDISSVSAVARDLENKLPGVFWLNRIDSVLANALGGRAGLTAALSNQATIEDDQSGGLIITLGAEPTYGDVNRRAENSDRVAFARLAYERGLLHVPQRHTYFHNESDLSSEEAQERWHLRLVT